MSSSPATQRNETSARFFGMDVAALRRDCWTAWREMGRWPVIAWMWPRSDIGVLQADGSLVLSRSLDSIPVNDERRARSARFGAVVLPEDILLRRTLQLPKLQADDLQAALWLEVQSISPFAAEDLQWTYQPAPSPGSQQTVHLVLASRKMIAKVLDDVRQKAVTSQPEVWVPSATGPGFAMLAGYGETTRMRRSSTWAWAIAALTFLLFGLLLAIAITPSAQLYLRTQDAAQAMKDLQKRAAPVLAEREALLRSTEQLAQAQQLVGNPLPPLQILQIVTDALPDDTSVTNLQVQGLKVSIAGQTPNAASLMKQLGNIPGLRDVRAPSPAVKPLGAPKESFAIEFHIEPALLKSPSPSESSTAPIAAVPIAGAPNPMAAASGAVLPAAPASAPGTPTSAAITPASGAASAAKPAVGGKP